MSITNEQREQQMTSRERVERFLDEREPWVPDQVRYRIAKDDEPDEDGNPETHPWKVNVIRNGEWSGACCYKTFAEALAEYVADADARVTPSERTDR